MGLLDGIFGNNQSQRGGGPSGMTLALLALLAYRTYHGKGRLADMLGRNGPQGGAAPDAQLPPGTQPMPGQGAGTGGLGGLLGGILGGSGQSGGLGDLLRNGGLGNVLGSSAGGGFLGEGLNELMKRMQQNGHSGVADSWVGTGQNTAIAPDQLEQAVGKDTLRELSTETGKPYDTVLSDLVKSLPGTVDKLTPAGRLPTAEEHSNWI